MNRSAFSNLTRTFFSGWLGLPDCFALYPAVTKYLLVPNKEYPFKGSYLYQEKNIRPKEGNMQLNFPINT